ncbi:MAG: tRNA uridine-5-carboxymethylaminomethyl(34) synthesis GTPase MnmE, partial [Gammaproteobacteria bacterium]
MVENTDTIVAIATPPGRGGIGVIRLSGAAALEISHKMVRKELWPRYAHFCKFLDRDSATIDEGLAIHFPAPGSYTGEDVVEFHAHGSRAVLDMLIRRAVELGARLARPGEFTERAFHNNRIDLVQAEAIADLIDSVSDQTARSAIRSLEGEFSRRINGLLDTFISLRVQIEGALDFPEEDAGIPAANGAAAMLDACRAELEKIFSVARQGSILNEGIIAVITGRPNVGKSTLLNMLAGREAAIVTAVPGTTRDLIEQDIVIGGVPLHIVDTAGLRTTGDVVEKEGIRRALSAAEAADILILINEYGQPLSTEERRLVDEALPLRTVILAHNKIDLHHIRPGLAIREQNFVEINLSAKTGAGVEILTDQLMEILGMQNINEDVFIARRRHLDALDRTGRSLQAAQDALAGNEGMELVAEHLRIAQHALGEITGVYAADDLLGEIFSRF